jgi:hypothetical protein
MIGWGEQYLSPLALALGVRESLSGLVTTVPFVIGALAGLRVPSLVRAAGSYRGPVSGLAMIQALAYLPLLAACLYGAIAFPVLLMVLAIYYAAGLATGPPWMAWADTLVPSRIRPRFFAYRTILARVVMGTSLLASGAVLEAATARGQRLLGFAVLMAVAFLARMGSAFLLSRQSDVPAPPEEVKDVPFTVLFSRRTQRRDGALVTFLLVFLGAVSIAMPLLPALMLEQRGLPYTSWSWIAAAPFLTRVLALPTIGRLAATRGAATVLRLGATGAVLVPALYLLPLGLPWYLTVALLDGVAGSAHTLGGFLLLFEEIRSEERCSIMSKFNVAVGASMAAGAGLGGLLLRALGEGALAYRVVFLVGSLATLASLAQLRRFLATEPEGAPRVQ